jgi:hypothetical protein
VKGEKKMTLMNAAKDAATPPEPYKPAEVRPTSNKNHAMTFRMSMETRDLLEKVAFEQRTTVQDVVAVALDEWLRKKNIGSFTYYKKVKSSEKQDS